jgi:hypothetical protein
MKDQVTDGLQIMKNSERTHLRNPSGNPHKVVKGLELKVGDKIKTKRVLGSRATDQ